MCLPGIRTQFFSLFFSICDKIFGNDKFTSTNILKFDLPVIMDFSVFTSLQSQLQLLVMAMSPQLQMVPKSSPFL